MISKEKYIQLIQRQTKSLDKNAYPSVADIPGKVDLVVVSVDLSMTPPVLEDCAKKGVHSVVIVSGGEKNLVEKEQHMKLRSSKII